MQNVLEYTCSKMKPKSKLPFQGFDLKQVVSFKSYDKRRDSFKN